MHHGTPSPHAALLAERLSKHFVAGTGNCRAQVVGLRRATLVVHAGELVVLTGPAGSGKSTLLLCAAGLLRPDGGTLRWFGAATPDMARTRYVHGVREAMNEYDRLTSLGGLLLVDVVLESMSGTERRQAEHLVTEVMNGRTAVVMCARRQTSLSDLPCRTVLVERGVTRECAVDDVRMPGDRVAEARPRIG